MRCVAGGTHFSAVVVIWQGSHHRLRFGKDASRLCVGVPTVIVIVPPGCEGYTRVTCSTCLTRAQQTIEQGTRVNRTVRTVKDVRVQTR